MQTTNPTNILQTKLNTYRCSTAGWRIKMENFFIPCRNKIFTYRHYSYNFQQKKTWILL